MTGVEWTEADVEVATANFETLSLHLSQQKKKKVRLVSVWAKFEIKNF